MKIKLTAFVLLATIAFTATAKKFNVNNPEELLNHLVEKFVQQGQTSFFNDYNLYHYLGLNGSQINSISFSKTDPYVLSKEDIDEGKKFVLITKLSNHKGKKYQAGIWDRYYDKFEDNNFYMVNFKEKKGPTAKIQIFHLPSDQAPLEKGAEMHLEKFNKESVLTTKKDAMAAIGLLVQSGDIDQYLKDLKQDITLYKIPSQDIRFQPDGHKHHFWFNENLKEDMAPLSKEPHSLAKKNPVFYSPFIAKARPNYRSRPINDVKVISFLNEKEKKDLIDNKNNYAIKEVLEEYGIYTVFFKNNTEPEKPIRAFEIHAIEEEE